MKNECSVVKDLLPLYYENMLREDTAEFVEEHLKNCSECMADYNSLKEKDGLTRLSEIDPIKGESSKPFKTVMKRLNIKFHSFAYLLIIFFIFLGFGWTEGENLMYNSLLMPLVGLFGYYVFGLRAIYKVPVLLLIIDLFVSLFGLAEIDLYSAVLWTGIYSIFVVVGIVMGFLLHYALRKEKRE